MSQHGTSRVPGQTSHTSDPPTSTDSDVPGGVSVASSDKEEGGGTALNTQPEEGGNLSSDNEEEGGASLIQKVKSVSFDAATKPPSEPSSQRGVESDKAVIQAALPAFKGLNPMLAASQDSKAEESSDTSGGGQQIQRVARKDKGRKESNSSDGGDEREDSPGGGDNPRELSRERLRRGGYGG